MMKIGIIGKGFGKKIFGELSKKFIISWHINSSESYTKQNKVDWVYIATPIEYHYEQALFFLNNNTNVILEKVPVLSLKIYDNLIDTAKKNNLIIYFSDLFRFREDIKSRVLNLQKIEWSKSTGKSEWIVTRLAFHYLYLLSEYSDNIELKNIRVDHNYLSMQVNIEDKIIAMKCEQDSVIDVHKLDGAHMSSDGRGPISRMVDNILSSPTNISINHKITRLALKLLLQIKKKMPTIQIVGAGIFGCQSAIQLSKRGYNVNLHEKLNDIISSASMINQYRVHRGYHYPRSDETARDCKKSSNKFQRTFREAIFDAHESYYSISSERSLTSKQQYIEFLNRNSLEYEVVLSQKNCDLTVKVLEPLFDPHVLKEIIRQRLLSLNVNIILGSEIKPNKIDLNREIWVSATYARSGLFDKKSYQYEVCEKPVVKLPEKYANKSIVVMDGPFMCLDPYGQTNYHVLGNVVHAIHNANIGQAAVVPQNIRKLIDKGIIYSPNISNFKKFLKTFERYFDCANEVEYIGSMYTIRTVLPKRDIDDARPTLITQLSKNHIQIFSGKIVTVVDAAELADDLINNILKKNTVYDSGHNN